MNQDILNEAISKLKNGSSKTEVLSLWPEHKQQLEQVLDMVLMFEQLPKKQVPQPAMQRKYIFAPAKTLWLHWVHISRFAAVSVSVVLLATVGITTGYTAYNSHPGDASFFLKKAAEHLQVKLASSQEEKINLQVEIAQKRLNDAQQAVA